MGLTKVGNLLRGPLNFVNGTKIAGSGAPTKIFDPAKDEVNLQILFRHYVLIYNNEIKEINTDKRSSENLLVRQRRISRLRLVSPKSLRKNGRESPLQPAEIFCRKPPNF